MLSALLQTIANLGFDAQAVNNALLTACASKPRFAIVCKSADSIKRTSFIRRVPYGTRFHHKCTLAHFVTFIFPYWKNSSYFIKKIGQFSEN